MLTRKKYDFADKQITHFACDTWGQISDHRNHSSAGFSEVLSIFSYWESVH